MDELTQLRTDLMYLARRQRALEEALEEWTEFMTTELFKQGFRIDKLGKTHNYFKESLKDKFKADYDKFETLFSKVNKYFPERKIEKPKGAVPL